MDTLVIARCIAVFNYMLDSVHLSAASLQCFLISFCRHLYGTEYLKRFLVSSSPS